MCVCVCVCVCACVRVCTCDQKEGRRSCCGPCPPSSERVGNGGREKRDLEDWREMGGSRERVGDGGREMRDLEDWRETF